MDVSQVGSQPATTTPPRASKMSLKNVRSGIIEVPHRVLIYGPEKVGKSTFAAGAPRPIFLGKDAGTEHLDVERLPQPETWKDVIEGLAEVERNGRDAGYKSLVVDPVGWLEPLAIADFAGDSTANLSSWGGGHGAGYTALAERWRFFLKTVERIWERGLNVVFVAHANVKQFNDPEGPPYDRYEIALDKRAAGMLRQWVESILFARRESYGKVDPTTRRARAAGSSARIMHTEWSPAFDAGNRWKLPPEMELSWHAYAEGVTAGKRHRAELLVQLEAALRELGDADVERKVREYLADPRSDVAVALNGVAAKLGAKAAAAEQTTNETETPKES